ncbi:MAG: hypothetical protein JSS67_08975 [Bacteroidetes bacterium]|nr:hypothetical protein [Bacteroidota bacterium]
MPENQKFIKIITNPADKETAGNAKAYLLDNQGNLIEKVSLSKGETTLKSVPEKLGKGTRLMIGSDIPKEFQNQKITSSFLLKMGAKEVPFHLSTGNKLLLPILPKFPFPLFHWCNIKGSLSKTFSIDNIPEVQPVCEARVHICEVDPFVWWWQKVPDPVFLDLINKLKTVVQIPKPIPDPGPIKPQISPSAIRPDIQSHVVKTISGKINNPELKNFSTSAIHLSSATKLESLPVLPDIVKNGIMSPSLTVAQNTIINNLHLLHPYFCLWPIFWPWLYRCDEIAVVTTDCLGKFEFPYFYFENGDKPDIYIWVEVNINGEWITVYKPSLPCGTYWDYACGTDINVRLTDSRIRPCVCNPIQGNIIWMKNVNTGTSIRAIQQNSASSGNQENAVGLNNYFSEFGNFKISPFGSTFPFIIQFGNGYPNSAATHYRWKYKRVKDAFLNNVSEGYAYLEGELFKNYTYQLPNGNFATKSFRLGADYDAGIPKYIIPHVHATDDVPESTAEWNQDTYSIYINSPNFSNGLYEFVFELTDNAGNLIPVNANDYVVTRNDAVDPPKTFPDEVTIHADGLPENYLIKNFGGQATGFRFLLRIDNQHCYANIIDALVGSGSTDTACGFGHFNDANHHARLRFFAGHPQNFGVYHFNVTKGNSGDVAVADSKGLLKSPGNGYSLSIDVPDADHGSALEDLYHNQFNVDTLLNGCPQAAFAEILGVWSTHTDGTNHLYNLDASDTAAIAIAPKS